MSTHAMPEAVRRDQHSRVSSRATPGFLERLSDTAGGMLLGVGVFALSFYVLFTNEGRALRTTASLNEGLSKVVPLNPASEPDFLNNNKLVHLSAVLQTSQSLHDPNYRIEVKAVKLKREVEMYQWVEHQESRDYQEDGETKTETTYTYTTEWRSEVINSRNFDKEIGHVNPSAMAVESVTVVASDVWVGSLSLSKGLVDKISNFQRLHLGTLSPDPFLTVHGDYFYHTAQPNRPEVCACTHTDTHTRSHTLTDTIVLHFLKVGDVRVSFSYAGLSGEGTYPGPAQMVSVVAMQKDGRLVPYKTTSGDHIEILYLEELSAQEVFEREHQMNSMMTWALRAAGWALMFLGISLATRIVHTLVDWLPLVRDVVNIGLRLFALCVSCSLSLLTIAAGWLFYRPLVAGGIAALALLPVLLARSRAPTKKTE
ncbi:transmembrane protein 43 isoform X1 [Brienomyrus brachyistius]|uniref:transmembrane protein 43 isoform X1 n=1 Tax=Brienomyrus brachyistius TaxID=42636 RepID=UPI0020B40ED1|nr:transmembrane protein 43 isoform X1 [Brienomyrus brachyistius]